MKVKAAVLYGPGRPLEVEEIDLEPPRAGEVLVRIGAAGICRSDYHYIAGDARTAYPIVLGHEGSAVVEAVGEGVFSLRPGDPVVLSFVPNCGRCRFCSVGRPQLCDAVANPRVMPDGTTRLSKGGKPVYHFGRVSCFASHAVVPESGCIPIPPSVPLDRAALIGCSVTTGVAAVLVAARVEPGASVAVVGVGGVGLNVVQGARLVNANPIIAIDVLEEKLEFARRFGATHTINADREDPVARVRELTEGRGADYAFEVFGGATTTQMAYECTAKGGTLVVVGIAPQGDRASIDLRALTFEERTVKGTYYGSARIHADMGRILRFYQEGRLDLDSLITRRYSLEEINQAFDDLARGKVGRGVITTF